MKNKSILYINFSPYENAGNILDYLLDTFGTVILFSFRFHTIKGNRVADSITIFRQKRIVKQYPLFAAPVISTMTFYLLPFRSFIILLQVLSHCFALRRTYGPFDIFFTVNAYTAWLGNILRSLGVVKKTIFWVWDYYPPVHKDPIVRTMRYLYWQFDKPASTQSDRTVFLNKRLADLRKKMNILPHREYPVVPIGTNPISKIKKTKSHFLKLVFFGVLKKSQGLDAIFDAAPKIVASFKNAQLHIIGNGPDKEYFKNRSHTSGLVTTFYGYIDSDTELRRVISACDIGLATYMPDVSNVSYYTDPSKIKMYLSLGIPTIMTDFLTFSREISTANAGVVVTNTEPEELLAAIKKIMKNHSVYRANALRLAKRFQYKKIYPELFKGVGL